MNTPSQHSIPELASALLNAMRRDGIEPLEPIAGELACGRLIRFRADGDKPGRRNGWAIVRPDGWAFGHWRLDVRRSWSAIRDASAITGGWSPSRGNAAAARLLVKRERMSREREAADSARNLWESAPPAAAHPYLAAKRMTPDGLRQSGPWLLVPMHDLRSGELANVQRIGPDGAKRFHRGAPVAGLTWGRGTPPGGVIALCEGVATAAAVHAATGVCAVAAMSKGELVNAALSLRRRWSNVRLIAGADHDVGGGGEKAARDAMHAVGGMTALPPRPPGWDGPAWDYADLWLAPGGAALIRAAFSMGDGA